MGDKSGARTWNWRCRITFVINHHKNCIRIHLNVSHWNLYHSPSSSSSSSHMIALNFSLNEFERILWIYFLHRIWQHNFQSLLSSLARAAIHHIFCDLVDIEISLTQKIFFEHIAKNGVEWNSFNNAALRVLMVSFMTIHLKFMNCVIEDKANGINFELKHDTTLTEMSH